METLASLKKYSILFLFPALLLGQSTERDWSDTNLIVNNVTVSGTISGFAELEFESVTQMKAFDFSQTADGARVKCNGYNVANDGLFGPDVFWRTTSTSTDDRLSVFDPDLDGTGRLERSFVEPINPYWAGAVGDGVTDDTVAIQAAVDAASGSEVFFTKGTYLISAIDGNNDVFFRFQYGASTTGGGISNEEGLAYAASGLVGYTDADLNLATGDFITSGEITSGQIQMGSSLTTGDWDEPHLEFGSYHVWNNAGELRIKSSAPVNATDGAAVGGVDGGDMLAATYDAAGVSEQLVGLTAIQTLTNKTFDATSTFDDAQLTGETSIEELNFDGTPSDLSLIESDTLSQVYIISASTTGTGAGAYLLGVNDSVDGFQFLSSDVSVYGDNREFYMQHSC